MYPARFILAAFVVAPLVPAQSAAPPQPDGLSILQRMSEHYAAAKSWYIAVTEESTSWNEYNRNWTKTLFVSAVSGNRYRFEGHSQMGSALHISDGTTAWDLHPEEHAYVQKAAPANGYESHFVPLNEMAAQRAVSETKELAKFASHYSGASRLPDAIITIDGKAIPCYVVHLTPEQRKGPRQPGYTLDQTLWIEKATWALRKSEMRGQTFLMAGSGHIPMETKAVETYTTAESDGAIPDSLFQFTPPHDAKLVARFSGGPLGPDLTGSPAPNVQLVSADGKQVSLSSYRGRPVLLDFWATWCTPCTEAMPKLAELYKDAAPQGLILLSIDEDEDAKTATDYLAQHHYTWPNMQDNGKIGDAFSKIGIPLYVVIDAGGNIVFYATAPQESALRKAVAALGPQFASLLPRDKPNPCETATTK